MKNLILIFGLLFTLVAHAGFEGKSNGTSLKIFDKINCGAGLTCTRGAGGTFNMVSSPTISAGSFDITAAEATDAVLSLIADEGDDDGDTWKLNSVASSNDFIIYNDISGSDVAKFTLSEQGNISLAGDIVGNGAGKTYGLLHNLISATATTITAAQCGSTFYNAGAVVINLPEASTAVGCQLTFVTMNASNFDINPDNADQILVQTNAAGDAIRNATLGNVIVLQAMNASQWVPVSVQGTWSDVN